MSKPVLQEYSRKRHFSRTAEPRPAGLPDSPGPLVFVVQKHAARRLHYDFRLELDGVLKSWALPRGPSLNPVEKRLAVMVEDHPLDYRTFEGVIPEGEYGAGQVIVWDTGAYAPDDEGKLLFHDREQAQQQMRLDITRGKISIHLRGHKMKGSWALVKMRGRGDNWLLIKHQDRFADATRNILDEDSSVLSGLTIGDLKNERSTQNRNRVPSIRPGGPGELSNSRPAPMPEHTAPMLAGLADAPFSGPEWLFEPKLDGYRALAFIREGGARLKSRRGLDVTARYPDIAADLGSQPIREMVLDGEIVALDKEGRPCFQCLQQHLESVRRAETSGPNTVPVIYYVFDIIYLDGYDLKEVTLEDRKGVLARTLSPAEHVRLVEYFEGDGKAIYQAVIASGLEGIIAKRRTGPYEPGRRSQSWLKIKGVMEDDFVVGGFSRGSGSRAGTFGALLLGYYDEKGQLIYAGHVGTGFSNRNLTEMRTRLDAIISDRCPFASVPPLNSPATWVRPEMVAEVKFAQRTRDGYLRMPVFLGLRDDKPPDEVRRVSISPGGISSQHSGQTGPGQPQTALEDVLEGLKTRSGRFVIEVEGHEVAVSNVEKELWPAGDNGRALTKRDLLVYLAEASPYLLPHLHNRPLTLSRYPDGINGEHFYQKHWSSPLPEFVKTARLFSSHGEGWQDYIICNNLATLLWLGQMANIELHTWFSRISPGPDMAPVSGTRLHKKQTADSIAGYPDFIIFDLDPYIYSGNEAEGAEPELSHAAFARTCEAAIWLKEVLDSLSLSSFVKTSGRTGLHVYVPVFRQFNFTAARSAAKTISRFLLQQHPQQVTMDWTVEKRAGKVFLDYNQNMRGKTLACAYSPRPSPEAAVSTPLRWEELGTVYPTDFTIRNMPRRLQKTGDLWASIDDVKSDLKGLLSGRSGQSR